MTVNLSPATQTATGAVDSEAVGDTISGFESVIGGDGNDTLIGSALANMLVGGGANDTITGNAGNDTINGGAGADTLSGGVGTNDVLDYSTDNIGVTVDLSQATQTATGEAGSEAEGDTISGFESVLGGGGGDTFTGGVGVNLFDGGAGGDTLNGGAGNDTLTGGRGDDELTGGGGADIFRFAFEEGTTDADADTITDFSLTAGNVDKIGISKAGFGLPAGLTQAQFASAEYLVIGADVGPTKDHAQFLYDTASGGLFFDANGTGDDGLTQIATLTGDPDLVFGNFLLLA